MAAALLAAAPAYAEPTLRDVGEFEAPVQIAAPPGDERLFVVEQAGRIELLGTNGAIAAQPFLDLTAETLSGGERGLLGLAFAPDYATTGEFFVYLTAKEPVGEIQIRRYRVAAADPDRADPASGATILRQAHDRFANHNGGGLRFGPDGKLWAALGDGGGSNDPLGAAQNRTTLLGKLLRLERDGSAAFGNPFAAATDGTRPEIFHLGLRNAFRFSFDRATGDLVIADVGQNAREEVDVAPAAEGRVPGANWGWPCFEGTRVNAQAAQPCVAPEARPPTLETDHDADGAVSITGGVVVRDPGVPGLLGRYLFGDLGFSTLHSAALGTGDERPEPALAVPLAVSIDEDGCGRVVVTSVQGRVARLVDGAVSPCPTPVPETGPGATPAPTATPVAAPSCGLSARAARTGRRVSIGLVARAPCVVRLRLRRGGSFGRERQVTLLPGAERTVRLRLDGVRTQGRRLIGVRLLFSAGGRTKVRHLKIAV